MPKDLPLLARNLRYLRQTKSVTQDLFAQELGIKRSLLGAYEEGRATPRYDMLDRLSALFSKSIPDLLNKEMAPTDYEPPKRGRSKTEPAQGQATIQPRQAKTQTARPSEGINPLPSPIGPAASPHTSPLGIKALLEPGNTIAVVGLEQISQYATLCQQPVYLQGLTRMALPWSEQAGTGRAFAIADRHLLICSQVRNWYTLQEGRRYVVVHQDGLYTGTILNRLDSRDRNLVVHPTDADPVTLADMALVEIWQVDYELHPAHAPTAELPPTLDKRLRQILTAVQALG